MDVSTNCTELFLERNLQAGLGSRLALIEVQPGLRRSLTYSELSDAVERACVFLNRHVPAGGGAGVMIAGSTSLETVVFWIATMRTGNVAVLAHPQEDATYYEQVLVDVRPALTLADDSAACSSSVRMPTLAMLRSELLPGQRSALHAGEAAAGRAALALLSSGSTGRPKVCVHSHAAFRVFQESVSTPLWKIAGTDRMLATSGPHFSFGLQGIHVALSVGATAILQKAFNAHTDFLDTIETEAATVLLAVPTLYHLLWQRCSRPCDLGSLRLSISAGERLPTLVRDRWETMSGSMMIDSIGSTETFLPFLSQRVDCPGGSLQPVAVFDYRLKDRSASQGSRPRVCSVMLRSEAMMCGILRDGRFHPRSHDIWFDTGDVFEHHADGFRFVSRRSEGFKIGGQWVCPQRLEEALLRLPGVALAAATAVETPEGLIRLRAYVVLSDTAKAVAETWLKDAQATIAQMRPKILKPESIRIVDALPVTRTGKLLRARLVLAG